MATEYGIDFTFGPSHMYAEDCEEIFRKFKWFSPTDWIVRVSFSLKFESEMIPWMKDNCRGSWLLVGWAISRNAKIEFSRSEDAMAFKLRWM